MNIFYSKDINKDTIVLRDEEFTHCIKSLRKRIGDRIIVTNGAGMEYMTEVQSIEKRSCDLNILELIEHAPPQSELVLAVAPTKNMSRYEWFVEKAVEIGVTRVVPIICKNSERKRVRLDRLKKIALSAMKQSKRWYLTQVDEAISIGDFIKSNDDNAKFVAHFSPEAGHLKDLIKAESNCTVLIGPEGDFANSELEWLEKSGYTSAILSNSRLRTETAAIVACNIFNLANQ